MTSIDFYFNAEDRLQVACRLAAKAASQSTRMVIYAPDGDTAVKRQVRLGRRNADYIEVLEGLDPGERVITSPYTGFAERDQLDLSGETSGQ